MLGDEVGGRGLGAHGAHREEEGSRLVQQRLDVHHVQLRHDLPVDDQDLVPDH